MIDHAFTSNTMATCQHAPFHLYSNITSLLPQNTGTHPLYPLSVSMFNIQMKNFYFLSTILCGIRTCDDPIDGCRLLTTLMAKEWLVSVIQCRVCYCATHSVIINIRSQNTIQRKALMGRMHAGNTLHFGTRQTNNVYDDIMNRSGDNEDGDDMIRHYGSTQNKTANGATNDGYVIAKYTQD
eukprot:112602_1